MELKLEEREEQGNGDRGDGELDLPSYNFSHTRPVVLRGNFSHKVSKDSGAYFDDTVVNRKFALADKVVRENLLEHPDLEVRRKAVKVMEDKTVMAYLFLRYDGEPVKLMPHQDAVLADKSRRKVFCGCNQHVGKSFALNVDAATSFMKDHGKNWVGILVSGSLDQSKFQMDRIKMLLKSSKVDYKVEETVNTKKGKKDNVTQITYTFYDDDKTTPLYKNTLICCPHTSSALGYPANEVWLDELDFWENCDQEKFMFQVIMPRMFKTKGRVSAYSNPDGKEKMMHTLWRMKTADGRPAWHRYHFNYWDKPGATQEEFEECKIGMTKTQVESTLLAVFTRTEGTMFSNEEVEDMKSDLELVQKGDQAGHGREVAFFLDIGAVHDQSVLIGGYTEYNEEVPEMPLLKMFWVHKYPVGYPLARVVGVDAAVDVDDGWEDYASDNPTVKDVLGRYEEEYERETWQPLFGYDATGNMGMQDLMKAAGVEAVGVVFSGPKKWHMAQRFQAYAQQRFVKRALERDDNTVRRATFDRQFKKIVIKKTKTASYRKVRHENEDDLDDCFDAAIGLLHLIENPDLPSLSFDIIPHEGKGKEQGSEDEEDDVLQGQYVPSYATKAQFRSWVENKVVQRK